MTTLNPNNERIKSGYSFYLSDAKGKDEETIDKAAATLVAFEHSTRWRPSKCGYLAVTNCNHHVFGSFLPVSTQCGAAARFARVWGFETHLAFGI